MDEVEVNERAFDDEGTLGMPKGVLDALEMARPAFGAGGTPPATKAKLGVLLEPVELIMPAFDAAGMENVG